MNYGTNEQSSIAKILVDINGADQSPHALVDGAVLSLSKTGFNIILAGQKDTIEKELSRHTGFDKSRIDILHCDEIITPDEKPTEVIRTKKESSLVKGLQTLKTSDDIVGMISAGNTGAILAGGVFILGRIQGISRPCLSALLPNLAGGKVCIGDVGANVDSKPEYINQFAILTSCYLRSFLGLQNPRVGLLNNGTEDTKGNDLTKASFALLKKNSQINFYGNLEARNALDNVVDSIVTDGFAGNVLLKSIEGTSIAIFKMLKEGIMSGGLKSKMGALMLKSTFGKIRTRMDYQNVGGAPLLGLNKILLKCHGSSQQQSIAQSIWDVHKMHTTGMIEDIKTQISKLTASVD